MKATGDPSGPWGLLQESASGLTFWGFTSPLIACFAIRFCRSGWTILLQAWEHESSAKLLQSYVILLRLGDDKISLEYLAGYWTLVAAEGWQIVFCCPGMTSEMLAF
jgi:hypothetical protein